MSVLFPIRELRQGVWTKINESAKLHAIRVFGPYASSSCLTCLRAVRAFIFTRLNYAPCAPYASYSRVLLNVKKSLIKGNFKMF